MDKNQRSLRILLAEDNVVNQKVVTSMLQKRGHQVVVDEDGKKAVTAFEGGVFDLVLMDIQMPEMDGFEATAAIREAQKSNGTHTPVVAMTANAMQGNRERCLEAGMDGYIPKPVKARELLRGVEEAVESSGQTPINDLANQSAHGAFDKSYALSRVEGDEELLSEIASLFLDDYPRLLGGIHEAIEAGDSEALERTSHTLKGALGNLVEPLEHKSVAQLEKMGRDGELANAQPAYSDLEARLARLKPELERLLRP